jgi:hypothetical protein
LNNEASTSSSTNHVEEIKELKDQVTSLKKDVEKHHEGKSTLDAILSVEKSPNDKSGLGFKSNNKKKSKINKNKDQEQVKNLAKIICFWGIPIHLLLGHLNGPSSSARSRRQLSVQQRRPL